MARPSKRARRAPVAEEAAALVADMLAGESLTLYSDGRKRWTTFARRSATHTAAAFTAVMRKLRSAPAARARLAALRALDALFTRSNQFRLLCIDAIDEIVDRVLGKRTDAKLETSLTATLRTWSTVHGAQHARLRMAHAALVRRRSGARGLGSASSAHRIRDVSADRRRERQRLQVSKLQRERVAREFAGYRDELEGNLAEMAELFDMLGAAAASAGSIADAVAAATAEDGDVEWDIDDGAAPSPSSAAAGPSPSLNTFAMRHGLGDATYELRLAVPVSIRAIAAQTSARALLCERLLDGYRVIVRRHAPLLRDWLDALDEGGEGGDADEGKGEGAGDRVDANGRSVDGGERGAGASGGNRTRRCEAPRGDAATIAATVCAVRGRVAAMVLRCVAIGLALNTQLEREHEPAAARAQVDHFRQRLV